MGKLVATFSMFLAASALAIHESKPPPPPVAGAAPLRVRPADEAPPSRAIHDDVPPWVKYAAPPAPPTRPTPPRPTPPPPPPPALVTENGDYIDVVDRCPDQPNASDDDDGCPEPEGLRDRIILVE